MDGGTKRQHVCVERIGARCLDYRYLLDLILEKVEHAARTLPFPQLLTALSFHAVLCMEGQSCEQHEAVGEMMLNHN